MSALPYAQRVAVLDDFAKLHAKATRNTSHYEPGTSPVPVIDSVNVYCDPADVRAWFERFWAVAESLGIGVSVQPLTFGTCSLHMQVVPAEGELAWPATARAA